jgi:hypothetical protein
VFLSEVEKLVDRLGPNLAVQIGSGSVSVMLLLTKSTNQLATDSKSLLAWHDLNRTSWILSPSSKLSKLLLKGFGAGLGFVGGGSAVA